MAYDNSHVWAVGEILTAANFATYLRDNITYLKDSSRLENGGADEISVAGLSGLLADDQNPVAHGAAKHTDRNRTLPLIPFRDGTGSVGPYDGYAVYFLNVATENGCASFQIPVGFVSFISAIVGILPTTTGTFDWTVISEELDNGEAVGTDTDTTTADGQVATHATMLELDITAGLNNLTLAVGDWVSVKFTLDVLTTTTAIGLTGLSVTLEMDE